MICARCHLPIPDPVRGLRLEGVPLAPGAGPRLVETVLCGDCSSLLARFLAAGSTVEDAHPLPARPPLPEAVRRRLRAPAWEAALQADRLQS